MDSRGSGLNLGISKAGSLATGAHSRVRKLKMPIFEGEDPFS